MLFGMFGKEKRAEGGRVGFDDSLLTAILGGGAVDRETALQVPSVAGGIDLIAGLIAGTPIRLYREQGGEVEEVRDDYRLRLLCDEPGDTLNANEFWRAIVRDYYLGKGGYAYINRRRGKIESLHYVDERRVSIIRGDDPIFKDFDIMVNGRAYRPFEFLRVLRNTRDGAEGCPITTENAELIDVAYQSLLFEARLTKKGGNKRGFLKSSKPLTEEAMTALKQGFGRMYNNNTENVVVLNAGLDFQETSNTSVEMQLNENKMSNAREFSKIFHVSPEAMTGQIGSNDISSLAKLAAIPLMVTIQCALNRDLLLEKEKGTYYWAFDTKELLKGDMRERFAAYREAIEGNFMQVDEVRYAEDLKPLGLTWIRLGLDDVLYDPGTKTIYTPNTNKTGIMGEAGLHEEPDGDMIEPRANPNHDPHDGRFTSGSGGPAQQKSTAPQKTAGKKKQTKTKYAPSKQRNRDVKVQLPPKTYGILCGIFGTQNPGAARGERRMLHYNGKWYDVEADGEGGLKTHGIAKD